MRVGIPAEIKNNENRVAITPAGVGELVRRGHDVLIQSNAGVGSRISDAAYVEAGATIVADADAVWTAAHVDEDYQISQWGQDEEAVARRAMRRVEFDTAVAVLEAMRA